jgi:hypothetical protein
MRERRFKNFKRRGKAPGVRNEIPVTLSFSGGLAVEWNNELLLLLLLVEEREREREGGMIEEVDRLAVFRSYSQELI